MRKSILAVMLTAVVLTGCGSAEAGAKATQDAQVVKQNIVSGGDVQAVSTISGGDVQVSSVSSGDSSAIKDIVPKVTEKVEVAKSEAKKETSSTTTEKKSEVKGSSDPLATANLVSISNADSDSAVTWGDTDSDFYKGDVWTDEKGTTWYWDYSGNYTLEGYINEARTEVLNSNGEHWVWKGTYLDSYLGQFATYKIFYIDGTESCTIVKDHEYTYAEKEQMAKEYNSVKDDAEWQYYIDLAREVPGWGLRDSGAVEDDAHDYTVVCGIKVQIENSTIDMPTYEEYCDGNYSSSNESDSSWYSDDSDDYVEDDENLDEMSDEELEDWFFSNVE